MACASPPPPAAALAPGFRFHPTDEELVGYYLTRKVAGRPLRVDAISEVDLYRSEPWDLPGKSRIQSRDMEWYFFCALDRKYANRSKTNRATGSGYWKTTGKDRAVCRGGRTIGMKKTLVFHVGRAPKGERTNWVMHEYRLEDEQSARAETHQGALVVCRIFQKMGPGPQNGAHYGAPFLEEEWEVDELPVVKEEDGEGALTVLNGLVLMEMDDDDDEQTKNLGVQDENAALFVEPDGRCGFNDFVDPGSMVKTSQEQGIGIANDGNTGLHELQNDQSLHAMGGHSDAAEPNWSPTAPSDEYLELNDFANTVGAKCQENFVFHGETLDDENFVNGGIACPQEVDGLREYFNTIEENSVLSEQCLLSEAGADNNDSVEMGDLLVSECDDNSSGEPADDGIVYYDSPNHYPQADCSLSSEINNFIDATMGSSNGPDLMDELIAYFDATENMQPSDLNFESGTSSNQHNIVSVTPSSIKNMANGKNVEAYLASPEAVTGGYSTSSSVTPDVGKWSSLEGDAHGEPDAQHDNSWDDALSKRLFHLLDAIAPHPAFTAEYPTKGQQSIEHRSTVCSSSLTAGMLQIHSVTISKNGKNWFMQKNMDAAFILSHGMTSDGVIGHRTSFERTPKMPCRITLFVLHNCFHLLFLSVLFLAASFKIGVYVYTR